MSLRLPVEMVYDQVRVRHEQGEEWVCRVLEGVWLINLDFRVTPSTHNAVHFAT